MSRRALRTWSLFALALIGACAAWWVLGSADDPAAGVTRGSGPITPLAATAPRDLGPTAPRSRRGPTRLAQTDPLQMLEDERRTEQERLAALPLAVRAAPAEAGRALRRLLIQPRVGEALTLAAVRALATPAVQAADPDALPSLLRLLARAEEPELALAIADALETAEAPPAEDLLPALERAPLPEARVAAARALSRARPPEVAVQALRRRLAEDASPLVRGEALELLALLDPPEAERQAVQALAGDPQLAVAATRVLVRGTDPQAERLLRSGFLGAEPRSAASLACGRALALRAPAFLRETALGVSERALSAVEALDHARDADGLREVLASGGCEEARAAALRSLARTGRIARLELAALADSAPSPRLRQEARRALAPAAEPAAVPPPTGHGAAQ